MSTIELRHIINEHLSHIEDASFLNAIKTIIETKVSSDNYKLSEFQKERINKARQEYQNGQSIKNEDLQNEVTQWLGTR
jgi:hypothetical protein